MIRRTHPRSVSDKAACRLPISVLKEGRKTMFEISPGWRAISRMVSAGIVQTVN